MLRPYTQSLMYVVSCRFDALVRYAGLTGKTTAIRQRKLNYLQRLILSCDLTHLPADSFTRFQAPVETSTSPYWIICIIIVYYPYNYEVSFSLCQVLFVNYFNYFNSLNYFNYYNLNIILFITYFFSSHIVHYYL